MSKNLNFKYQKKTKKHLKYHLFYAMGFTLASARTPYFPSSVQETFYNLKLVTIQYAHRKFLF